MTTTLTTCTEEELKREAEELVRIAVRQRVAINQIRSLFSQARTKGLVEFEMHLKYQMGRKDKTTGGPIVSRMFGDRILSVISRCQKQGLTTILRWTAMLYEYEKMTSSSGTSSSFSSESYEKKALSGEVEKKIDQVIRQKTIIWGFGGTSIEHEPNGKITIRVVLSKFYGDPKTLSDELKALLRSEIREIGNSNTFFRVWIDKGVR
jgi:hypothetical protein